jgi:hypothetical protein
MNFHQYLRELDIHFINYSNDINLEEGLSFIEKLEKCFNETSNDARPIKVLLDVRGYKKENPETHDALAKIARKKLMSKINFLAVLNDQYNYAISENEHWCTNKQEAINWLAE